ncbi:hypothetical protein BRADO0649 [Bradyrhizobium sp. ORS 278]|uniref:hypothetical protein n=1 Tax=Bradyrhizobium sp. (strain ORS 278) TaxID=114615 RepID=UPI0001507CF6|nr:hypothetical protein [Bradyrhizobium sp. ORS 278]CAL74580.1 hypothetical protein BRADO0649 [Bradyrhizobium sp. ORS 278]
MTDQRKMSLSELQNEIEPWLPVGLSAAEVTEGVALALVPPSQRTLPIVRNPLGENELYAWSEDDASATKLALKLLGELMSALFSGHASLLNLGIATKEVVSFLIDIYRHHVQVRDPLQIKILLLLRDVEEGLSADQIWTRLGPDESIATIEQALDALTQTVAKGGPRPLVRCDRTIWKILV